MITIDKLAQDLGLTRRFFESEKAFCKRVSKRYRDLQGETIAADFLMRPISHHPRFCVNETVFSVKYPKYLNEYSDEKRIEKVRETVWRFNYSDGSTETIRRVETCGA